MKPVLFLSLACLCASPVAFAQSVQPGQWQSTHRIVSIEGGPTLPPAMAKAMMEPKTSSDCVTPERAASAMANLTRGQGNCQPKRPPVLAGGVLDAEFSCTRADGPMTLTAKGPFAPTGYSLDLVTVRGGAKPMTMRLHFDARRVGECSARQNP